MAIVTALIVGAGLFVPRTGIAAPPQQPATHRISAACFWSVPGERKWVNLYAVETFYVSGSSPLGPASIYLRTAGGKAVAEISFAYRTDTPLLINQTLDQILKRIDECESKEK